MFLFIPLAAILPGQAQVYERMFSFTEALANTPNKGSRPYAGLVENGNGDFYGTTLEGGAAGNGTIFKVTASGVHTTLVEFTDMSGSSKGRYPCGDLVRGVDGNFYGVTFQGGTNGGGTAFKMTPSGLMTTLVNFNTGGVTSDGVFPKTGLAQGRDGNFYGMTSYSTSGFGTIFKLTPAGVLTTLVGFTGTVGSNKGSGAEPNFKPQARLVEASNGDFYGTTQKGGAFDYGTVFKMTPAGVLTTLVEFSSNGPSNKGSYPNPGLVEGTDGSFYGTTETGGSFGYGTVFKMTPAGSLTTLVMFTGFGATNKGSYPKAGVVEGSDGGLYGTTYEGGPNGTAFKMTKAGVLTTLVEFPSDGQSNGRYGSPVAGLVQGADGSFYGTTLFGGELQFGTVYKLTPTGGLTVLVKFSGSGVTGSDPSAGLVQDSDGSFYGTTRVGGPSNFGTVFKITPGGDLTTLAAYQSGVNDLGFYPFAPLLKDSDGFFYGTTQGSVFKMTPSGVVTTLVNFTGTEGPNKGIRLEAGLMKGRDGEFYGVTAEGGAQNQGTIFRITPAGLLTTLVEFTGTNGSRPKGSLIQGGDGNIYGTTSSGGTGNFGTIYQMTPAGGLTTLVEFTGSFGASKGSAPNAGLVSGGDGSFYGTTAGGGQYNSGTAFKVTSAGMLTTLVEFSHPSGTYPYAGLLKDNDGNFYGTTSGGGAANNATVFKMTPAGVLTTIFEFTASASEYGRPQEGELIRGADGNLYGTARTGTGSGGSIYRLIFPGPPVVANAPVMPPGATTAIVQAKVNARGDSTAVTLEYWTGGINPPDPLPTPVPVAVNLTGYQTRLVGTTLTGLTPGTVYYYRFRAVSNAGMTAGPVAALSPVQSVTTLAPPTAAVSAASNVLPTSAQFNGTVNAQNYPATVIFEYGTDGNTFPNSLPAVPGTVTGNTAALVSSPVAGLTQGLTYYYRLVATNAGGTVVTGAQAFTTLTEPLAITGEANALSTTRAEVSGSANPLGSNASVSFEYGTDGINFPNSFSALPGSVSGSDPVAVSATLTGLQQGTTYSYRIRATGPGGTGLGATRTFSLSILSGLAQVFPDPPPSATGTVTINFDPPTRGAWRFAGESLWRNSGIAATNLASGQRLIEFLPVAGYIPPPVETLDVVSGGNLVLNRMYFETQTAGSGGLTVHLKPDALADPGVPEATRAQWRFVGESLWRDGDGPPVSSLSAGSYLVECKPVTGKVTPPTASIAITNGSSSELTLTYFTANNTGAATPVPLSFSSVSADEDLPFAYVGQIRSEVGSSTGFVVKRRVVATAGHVVFDDGSLSYVKSMEWLFQRHAGQFEPKPQVPRGSYLATGYATQRIADNSPGQGSPQSQTLDYAALYFLEEAGRGGYGGFLATDAGDENEFLTSTSQKILAGYAVDGIPATDKGKLHATTAFTAALSPAFGETWIITAVRGYGGCSGGPLFVRRPNGLYLPAAIYLGGNGQTVVRAIDSSVVDLFLRAEVSGNGGDNNTGGGITLANFTSIGNATQPGALQVTIEPAAARAAGAGWRLKPETLYSSSGSKKSGLSAGNYQLQLSTVSGFQAPTQYTVTVTAGQLQPVIFTYAAENVAPTIANVANLTIDEDTASNPISISVDDPDGPNSALVLTGTSSNTGLIPNGNIAFAGSGSNRSVTITPAANQNGSATITLTISDGDLTDSETFVVTVAPVNDAPTITNISAQSIPVNTSTAAIPLTIGDIETASSSLALARSTSNSSLVPLSNIVFGGSGASRNVTITPASNQLGSASIMLTVSDGALTTSRTFTLTVTGTAQETWRFTNFGTTANTGTSADTFDADGDGSTNQNEYAAGTNPNSAADVFKILTSTKTATTFSVTAAGKASRSYILERRATLNTGPWTTVVSIGPLASDAPVALTDPASPQNTAFYRLRVSAP